MTTDGPGYIFNEDQLVDILRDIEDRDGRVTLVIDTNDGQRVTYQNVIFGHEPIDNPALRFAVAKLIYIMKHKLQVSGD